MPLDPSAAIFATMSEDERGILLVEDDPALALGLSDSLLSHPHILAKQLLLLSKSGGDPACGV